MEFSYPIIKAISFLTLLADFALLFILVVAFLKTSPIRLAVFSFISKNALLLSFLVSLSAVIGASIFSEGIGFEPCLLCWYQRILLYPQAVLFAVALKKKDVNIFNYTLPLSYIGVPIAFYQSFVQWGGVSLFACTAQGADCAKVFFTEFSFITIPVMSLTIFLLLIAIGLIQKNSGKSV